MSETAISFLEEKEMGEEESTPDYMTPELLARHHQKRQEQGKSGEPLEAGRLILKDVIKGADIKKLALFPEGLAAEISTYNITDPVEINNQRVIFARVEPRGGEGSILQSEEQSHVIVFKETPEGGWELSDAPVFDLQDPFYCGEIEGEHIFGGVKVHREKDKKGNDYLGYHTVFYKFKYDIKDAEEFMTGPDQMKSIRLIQDQSGTIHIMSRPQGEVGSKGRIAYHSVKSLAEASDYFKFLDTKSPKSEEMLEKEIIKGLCGKEEWVGANEIHILSDGNISVLCHIAASMPDPARRLNPYDPGMPLELKSYYTAHFIYDPKTRTVVQPIEIISTADDFEYVKPRKKDLFKVQYPGGLARDGKGRAKLYAGIGDTSSGEGHIVDPSWDYEQKIKQEEDLLKAA